MTSRISAFFISTLLAFSICAEPAVFVLDGRGKAVARVDVQRGAVVAKGSLPFADDATELLTAPNGKQLVALSAGNNGRQAAAAVVDAATLASSPRIDLGRGLAGAVFSRDGKSLFVLSPGSGDVSGVLYRIDLATSSLATRLILDRTADQFGIISDNTGVVFQKGGRSTNARVSFVSLDTLDTIATVDLQGKMSALVDVPGSGYLYGIGTNAVDVVSIADRKLVKLIPVGNDVLLGGVDEATRSLYVLGTYEKKSTNLTVIRGVDLAGTVQVGTGAPDLFRRMADGKHALVGNAHGVMQVSLPDLSAGPVAELYSGFTAVGMKYVDTATTPDARRVFLLMRTGEQCCSLTAADAESGKKMGVVKIGRKSRRVAQALFALAATAASYSEGRADAKAHNRSSFMYSVYTPAGGKSPRGAFAFGPDGKTLYVIDSGTDTVTALDVESTSRILDLDAPASVAELISLGDRTILATGANGLALIDSTANKVAESADLKGELRDVVVLPDNATALALSKGEVTVVDGRSAKTTARIAGLVDPVAAVYFAY